MADALPPRQVTLVLCLPDGTVLGRLPPFAVDVPWWTEARPVVAGARAAHAVDVTVLRLLDGRSAAGPAMGGAVTYLAEVAAAPDVALVPWTGSDLLADEPLRLPWARPGGPAADVAWADAALADVGTPRTAPAEQIRTWNLSSLWRLPTGDGAAWLKVVPPFFAHEGAVLGRLAGPVPRLLAANGPRILLAEIPGEDRWEASREPLRRMVSLLVGLQAAWVGRVDELRALGAPDWCRVQLRALAADVVASTAEELDADQLRRLDRLLDGWDDRFGALDACGVPDTLVHGDFHPGNVRGDDDRLVLLDWGDSGAGHPLLDQAAFLERQPTDDQRALRAHWDDEWRRAVPGCDPARAASLLEPVAAVRQAVIYRCFLDGIEPSERVYHADDPATWLRRAAALATLP